MAVNWKKIVKIAENTPRVQTPVFIEYDVEADATGGLSIFNANAPYKFEIVDVIVEARATSGSGTVKLTDGTNDITDTIACATDTAIDRAATIDDTYKTVLKNGTLKVVANGAADRGRITILAKIV